MKYLLFSSSISAFVIVFLGESFRRVNISSMTISSWNLFSTLTNHPLQPQECHLFICNLYVVSFQLLCMMW